MDELEEHKIATWRGKVLERFYTHCGIHNLLFIEPLKWIELLITEQLLDYSHPLISIDPDSSLYEGVRVLLQHKVHYSLTLLSTFLSK